MGKTVYNRWCNAFSNPQVLKVLEAIHQKPYRSIRNLAKDTNMHPEAIRRIIKGSKNSYSKLPLLIYWNPLYPKPKNNYNRFNLQLAPLGCLVYHILEKYNFNFTEPAAKQLIRELYLTMMETYQNQQKLSTIFNKLRQKSNVWLKLTQEVFECPHCRKHIFLTKKTVTKTKKTSPNSTNQHNNHHQIATGINSLSVSNTLKESLKNLGKDVVKENFSGASSSFADGGSKLGEKVEEENLRLRTKIGSVNGQILQFQSFIQQQPSETIRDSENTYTNATREVSDHKEEPVRGYLDLIPSHQNETTANCLTANQDIVEDNKELCQASEDNCTQTKRPTALNSELKRRLAARLRREYFQLYDEIESEIFKLIITLDRIAIRSCDSFDPEQPKVPAANMFKAQAAITKLFYKIYQRAALECGATIEQIKPLTSCRDEIVQWFPTIYSILSEKNETLRRNFLIKLANHIYYYFRVALSPYSNELGINFYKSNILSVRTFHQVSHKVELVYNRVSRWQDF